MRTKRAASLAALLTISNLAHAIDEWEYKLDFSYGSRSDDVNAEFNGALNDHTLAGSSALRASNLRIHEARIGYRFIGDEKWYVKGFYAEGWANSGATSLVSQDPHINNSNWSELNHDSTRASTSDFSIAIGRQFRPSNTLAFTPLLGYSNFEQSLELSVPRQTVCNAMAPQACILNNGQVSSDQGRWTTTWSGPWVGIDSRTVIGDLTLIAELQYHLHNFDGQLGWSGTQNLSQLGGFTQTGSGDGSSISLGASYWTGAGHINLSYESTQMRTTPGTQLRSVSGNTTSQVLSEVKWSSQVVRLGYTLRF